MPKKILSDNQAVWINETVKKDDEDLLLKLQNGRYLLQWLKRKIGLFRIRHDERSTQPSKSTLIKHVESLIKNLESLNDGVNKFPINSIADLNEKTWELYQTSWRQKVKPFNEILELLWDYWADVKNSQSALGEKPKDLEKVFLAEFAIQIEMKSGLKKTKSAHLAATILFNNGVGFLMSAANNPSKAREIVRNFENHQKKQPEKGKS